MRCRGPKIKIITLWAKCDSLARVCDLQRVTAVAAVVTQKTPTPLPESPSTLHPNVFHFLLREQTRQTERISYSDLKRLQSCGAATGPLFTGTLHTFLNEETKESGPTQTPITLTRCFTPQTDGRNSRAAQNKSGTAGIFFFPQ